MGHQGAEAPLLVEDQQGDLLVLSGRSGFFGWICGLYKPVERDGEGSWKYQKMDRDPLHADTWLLRDAEGYMIVRRRWLVARCTDGAATDEGLLQSKGSWLVRTAARCCPCWAPLMPDSDLQVGRFQMSDLEQWRETREGMSRSANESTGGSSDDELIEFSMHLRKVYHRLSMGHEGAEARLLAEDQQGDLLVVSGRVGSYGWICGLYKPVERDDKGSLKYRKMDRHPRCADTWLCRDEEGYKIVCRRSLIARCTDGATTDDCLLQSKGSWLVRTATRCWPCGGPLMPDSDLQVGRFQMSDLEHWRATREGMSRSAGESGGGSSDDVLIDFSTHLRKEAVGGWDFFANTFWMRVIVTLLVIAAATLGGHGLYLFLTYRQTWSLEKHAAIAGVSCQDADFPAVCFLPSQAIGWLVLHAALVALSVSFFVQTLGISWKLTRIGAQWLIDGRLLNRVVVRESAGLDMDVDGDRMLLGKVCVMGAQDWFMMFLKLGLLVFNVYSIFHRFRSLPQRDPEHRLNEALHVVSWSEVIVVGGVISEIVLIKAPRVLLRLCKLNDRSLRADGIPEWFVHLGVPDTMANARAWHYGFAATSLATMVTDARVLSSWSALRLITLLDSSYLMRVAKIAFEWPASYGLNFFLIKAAAAAIWVSMTIFLGSLGVLAFNCHLLKVDFVTEKLYSDWTLREWMSLAALVNNIAGIHDLDAVKSTTALYTVCRNKKDPAETERRVMALHTALVTALLQRYGVFWAAVLYFSHSADRWSEILFDMPDDFKWSAEMPDWNRGYGSP